MDEPYNHASALEKLAQHQLRALTGTGAVAGYEWRKGHIKLAEHAAHTGDEDAVREHVRRVLAQKLLRAGVGTDCQNRRALVLRVPRNAQLSDGISSPDTGVKCKTLVLSEAIAAV